MTMPKLSETLPHKSQLFRCWACGADAPTSRWMEHDEQDAQTPVVVFLCGPCADKIVEPHPRLYREMELCEPMPGAMRVCEDCCCRYGVTCLSQVAQINGGPGLEYTPMPTRVHVCRSPRRTSGWIWTGEEITQCSGKTTE